MEKSRMQEWAEERVDRMAVLASKAEKALALARNDLAGVVAGRPSDVCSRRFGNWLGMQPVTRTSGVSTKS